MLFKIIIAMLAFAANSVLCRLALAGQQIDPMSFSLLRVLSGAVVLMFLYFAHRRRSENPLKIEWNLKNAIYLAVYIVAFSMAYLKINAGVGALLLFGTVQLSMVAYGIFHGEKVNLMCGIGLVVAVLGILLLLPGANTPNLFYSFIMMISGLAWAAYSIAGKTMLSPLSSTLANFVLAVPVVSLGFVLFAKDVLILPQGIVLALLSGGLASSGAYILWYSIVQKIDRITASTVQLSVPCLAILGGSLFIGEVPNFRMIASTVIVLVGILLVIFSSSHKKTHHE
ncbi:DMT family transporter [Acinetobacter vivianii]